MISTDLQKQVDNLFVLPEITMHATSKQHFIQLINF